MRRQILPWSWVVLLHLLQPFWLTCSVSECKTSQCTADSARCDYWGWRSLGGMGLSPHSCVCRVQLCLSHVCEKFFVSFIPGKAKLNVKARLVTGWRDPCAHLIQGFPCCFLLSQHSEDASWSCALSWRHWDTRSQHSSEYVSCVNLIFCPRNRK